MGISGYVKAKPDSAYLLFVPHQPEDIASLRKGLRLADLTFARQLLFAALPVVSLDPQDRVQGLLGVIASVAPQVADVFLETPDTNDAKQLAGFLRKFTPALRAGLREAGGMVAKSPQRLHLLFLSSTAAYVAVADSGNASPWLMGIPRLRFPSGAPSRSTLKLEEAFLTFVDDPDEALRPNMTAVDLGAAPGGWTYQLARRHIRTIAIDNGSLEPSLLESGVVEHLRADGFRYRPPRPVDWLVCDMVEQPVRIAALVADWFTGGHCQRAVFNLKLPMKKRYDELLRCEALMAERLSGAGIHFDLRFKQLYHDREEVTGYLRREL